MHGIDNDGMSNVMNETFTIGSTCEEEIRQGR